MQLYFNCTIQELKFTPYRRLYGLRPFQLHHTGIKMIGHKLAEQQTQQFQLHHTGIKIKRIQQADGRA
ncbi:hypothetical protein HMPREF1990_00067 [Porphyromonas gingivalis W4087]|nr:hypothetical protein HMPREF1990_00067 [Porphyromonas gingivalis W4087]